MIYGYDSHTVNEYGLKQMREISLALSADDLRQLADFLQNSADELEGAAPEHWHRHIPDSLRRSVGCDVIVFTNQPQART